MTSLSSNVVRTECAECFLAVEVNINAGILTATIPSNGKRGAGHVPAHEVTEDFGFDTEGVLALWECPGCGYADSTYVDPAMRADLT